MQCSQCEENVTHPVCENCLSEQMECFLFEEQQSVEELRMLTKAVKSMTPVATCVLCGSDIHICRHCFSEEMQGSLEKELHESFNTHFDYSLEGF